MIMIGDVISYRQLKIKKLEKKLKKLNIKYTLIINNNNNVNDRKKNTETIINKNNRLLVIQLKT